MDNGDVFIQNNAFFPGQDPEARKRGGLLGSLLNVLSDDSFIGIIEQLNLVDSDNPVATLANLNALRYTSRFFSQHPLLKEKAKALDRLKVSFGQHHGFVLRPDGKLFAYGANDHGELGVGEEIFRRSSFLSQLQPVSVPDHMPIKQVMVRGHMMLALSAEGTDLYACGTFLNIAQLRKIALPKNIKIKTMALGDPIVWLHTAQGALYEGSISLQDGTIKLTEKLLPPQVKIKKIAAGDGHLVILTTNGKVYADGKNDHGQLGYRGLAAKNPKEMPFRDKLFVKDIAVGNAHTILVSDQDELYVCGKNDLGQLGLGDKNDQYSLKKIKLPADIMKIDIKQVVAGDNHTAVLTATGMIYRCGTNKEGNMGKSSTATECLTTLTAMPKTLGSNEEIVEIMAGGQRLFLRTADSKIYGWDANKLAERYLDTEENTATFDNLNVASVRPLK